VAGKVGIRYFWAIYPVTQQGDGREAICLLLKAGDEGRILRLQVPRAGM